MTTESFTLFWRDESPFSQWHPASFTVNGERFQCAEQFMMHGKALLFGDAPSATAILRAKTPREQKALGRKVRGFDEARWNAAREQIVYAGSHAKFTQNEHLLQALLATRGTTLVEASPLDTIWGVGLAEDNPRIHDRAQWRGLNLLGVVLTRLREDLLSAK